METIEVISEGNGNENHNCRWVYEFEDMLDTTPPTSMVQRICRICGRHERVFEQNEAYQSFDEVYNKFHKKEM